MAKLPWNMLGLSYTQGLESLKTCYEASNEELEEAIQRAKDEAFGYQQHIDEGGEIEGEWEDGHWLWTKDQLLELNVDAAIDALWEVRRAFSIALYHHWERGARRWTKNHKAKHGELVKLVEALGVKATPGLHHLYLIANTLKHNNPSWGQKLLDSRPDLLPAAQVKWFAGVDWYDATRIPHDDMLDLFDAALSSGASINTQFVTQ